MSDTHFIEFATVAMPIAVDKLAACAQLFVALCERAAA